MILKTIAQRQFLITFLQIIGVAAAYFITGKLGDLLAIPPSYATVIFPSSGIALASILLYGNRMAGGVLLGAFLLNASIPVTPNYFLENLNSALLITLAISSGATLQAVVAAYLVRRFASTPNILSNQKNILLFLFYGGFVSALVNSTLSVSLLVATGQMSAEAFLLNWLSWWGGDALGIIIFTPLVLVCLSTENPVWQGRRKAITLPILTMFLLTVMAVFYEIETSNSRIKMEFDQRTKELSSLMETAIISNFNALRFLNDFYITSKFVDENQFQTFVAFPLNIFPSMLNLGFAPVIKAAEREKFENNLKQNGVSNFQITEQDAETKKLVRAGNRPEYTPISFIESNKLSDNIRNLDLYFMPSRRDAMDKARDTGELFVTTNVTLVYEMGKYNGVVAFIPVYQTGLPHGTIAERRAAILGYNFAAFRNVEMVKFALKNQNLAGLSYRLIDNNAPVEKELLFASDEQEPAPEALRRNSNMLMRHTTFNLVGGRVWRFELTPTADYFIEHRSTNVWSILWLGLTLTIITIITVLLSAIRQFELVISNAELAFQNSEKEKRAAELIEFHLKNDQLKSQLNHMQKLESIGRLTSGIAHDFNNILACMLGYNEINKMDSEDITDESLRASVENNTKQIDLAGNRAVAS
ncbi:MAG: CHASE domain-containing protein [Methylococcaceae bacterium]